MATLEEQMENLREAVKDFVFEVVKALGLIRLTERLGMTPRPWVREREIRDRLK